MTERADAREISCSLERPPWMTATRSRSVTALPAEGPHGDRHDAAGRGLALGLGILVEHDAVLERVVRCLLLDLNFEARVLELLGGAALVLPLHVRNRDGVRPGRDDDLHRRAFRRLLARRRRLRDDEALRRLVGRCAERLHVEALALELRARARLRLVE